MQLLTSVEPAALEATATSSERPSFRTKSAFFRFIRRKLNIFRRARGREEEKKRKGEEEEKRKGREKEGKKGREEERKKRRGGKKEGR